MNHTIIKEFSEAPTNVSVDNMEKNWKTQELSNEYLVKVHGDGIIEKLDDDI